MNFEWKRTNDYYKVRACLGNIQRHNPSFEIKMMGYNKNTAGLTVRGQGNLVMPSWIFCRELTPLSTIKGSDGRDYSTYVIRREPIPARAPTP